MNALRYASVFAVVALLAASLVSFGSAAEQEEPEIQDGIEASQQACAPPCGYIWPRIGVETDVSSPYMTSKIREFPREVEVTVTYSWDMEQEGTGISDPSEEMDITILVTRTPAFLSAQLDRNVCSFTLVPLITEYEVCTLTMSVDVDEQYLPADEDELRETGHRLMLFAASEESGTYMKSYGLEDIRFRFDGLPPPADGSLAPDTDADVTESPASWAVLALLVAVSYLAARRSRR